MKKSEMKKSHKAHAEKKAVRKPRLTKEEREARKLKLQEERAAKKAARLAKREAKKQKEAEKKAAAKAKREERKAKKLARLQKQKEREAARKLKAKERKAKKLAEKKPRVAKAEVKLSAKEKIEAERNEWKALSAIRRYVKDNAKALAELDGDKLERKLKKLGKMGYEVLRGPDGKLLSVGYSFETDIKIRGAKPAPEKKEKKAVEEVQQPQDSEVAEKAPDAEDEPLLTDEEILEAAKNDKAENVEVLAGDTFADETEIAANADEFVDPSDADDTEEDEKDEDDDLLDDDDDDPLSDGSDISREQEEYRQEAFKEMEANGTWD